MTSLQNNVIDVNLKGVCLIASDRRDKALLKFEKFQNQR